MSRALDVLLEAITSEFAAERQCEMEARLDGQSHVLPAARIRADVEMGLLSEGARVLTPAWSAAFSDHDLHAANTQATELAPQTLISGGTCKAFADWAKGAGWVSAGTEVGKIQSLIECGS